MARKRTPRGSGKTIVATARISDFYDDAEVARVAEVLLGQIRKKGHPLLDATQDVIALALKYLRDRGLIEVMPVEGRDFAQPSLYKVLRSGEPDDGPAAELSTVKARIVEILRREKRKVGLKKLAELTRESEDNIRQNCRGLKKDGIVANDGDKRGYYILEP